MTTTFFFLATEAGVCMLLRKIQLSNRRLRCSYNNIIVENRSLKTFAWARRRQVRPMENNRSWHVDEHIFHDICEAE